jgi:hypothetical protein
MSSNAYRPRALTKQKRMGDVILGLGHTVEIDERLLWVDLIHSSAFGNDRYLRI